MDEFDDFVDDLIEGSLQVFRFMARISYVICLIYMVVYFIAKLFGY